MSDSEEELAVLGDDASETPIGLLLDTPLSMSRSQSRSRSASRYDVGASSASVAGDESNKKRRKMSITEKQLQEHFQKLPYDLVLSSEGINTGTCWSICLHC
eukprot:CAMPEP_0178896022 /NCGR_PEP_ID=MMETSP0786-20121207/919_1 /TAXON_ID=186022 /ORGANISM="Thalassionema frauenfeldii, Strain CCMP 1798" /LENGTH=101 /DNA_ID=CAMNT_0020566333 /DNA_START=148 /DNA_END=450 /DNA_ORIENTATION=+